MGKSSWAKLSVSDLELDLPLRYDVFNEAGDQIASANDIVSSATKTSWLQLGFDSIYIRVVGETLDNDLLQPHNPQVLKNIEADLKLSIAVLKQLSSERHSKTTITIMEFDELTGDLLENIQEDSAAALKVLTNSFARTGNEHSKVIAERSAQLSLLSMAIAEEMGLVPAECSVVGKIAMLHDISLIFSTKDELCCPDYYRLHPIHSAKLCETIQGIEPKVIMGVSQVHESLLGDGFPRGLSGSRIHRSAKIIGAADAYLTLIREYQPYPMPNAMHFHPTDAVGYLMYQAKQGHFDTSIVRSLVSATSLYPVGSRVTLSDQSNASVLRSTDLASKPIVYREDGKPIDLRYATISISSPDRCSFEPMHRSHLECNLWT